MKNVHFSIPEIYGETLSYYELLRKLVYKTNELIDNYNTVPDQIAEEVKKLDAYSVFTTALNWLVHSIATDNTKSKDAVRQYKKHDLLYATFNDTVNLYEAITDFTNVFVTELKVGENIREVNISELLIELRKLIDNEAHAREQADQVLQTNIDNEAQARTQADQVLQTNIDNEAQARTQADHVLQTNIDNEISTLRRMISSPYNFKGEVSSISTLPASGEVNDTYYVQDVKYKVTWTGSAWVQSSLSEADYQTELSELKGDLVDRDNLQIKNSLYTEIPFGKTITYDYTNLKLEDGHVNDSGELVTSNFKHLSLKAKYVKSIKFGDAQQLPYGVSLGVIVKKDGTIILLNSINVKFILTCSFNDDDTIYLNYFKSDVYTKTVTVEFLPSKKYSNKKILLNQLSYGETIRLDYDSIDGFVYGFVDNNGIHSNDKTSNHSYLKMKAKGIKSITLDTTGYSTYSGLAYAVIEKNNIFTTILNSSGTYTFDDSVDENTNLYLNWYNSKGQSAVYCDFITITYDISQVKITESKWKNKTWVCVGDSLTEVNSRTTKHYYDYISEKTGISVINKGVSGTGYINAIVSGTKPFWERVSELDTVGDVITIFGSINDMGYPLGSVTDTETNTICGCVNKTIDNILSNYPLANIGIVTPIPSYNSGTSYSPSIENNPMELYANALIDICKRRGIPCLDLYHCSSLRPWESSYRSIAFSKDDGNGIHPDETGHRIISPRFEEFLATLLI